MRFVNSNYGSLRVPGTNGQLKTWSAVLSKMVKKGAAVHLVVPSSAIAVVPNKQARVDCRWALSARDLRVQRLRCRLCIAGRAVALGGGDEQVPRRAAQGSQQGCQQGPQEQHQGQEGSQMMRVP